MLHTFTFSVSEYPALLSLPASKIKYEVKLKYCSSPLSVVSLSTILDTHSLKIWNGKCQKFTCHEFYTSSYSELRDDISSLPAPSCLGHDQVSPLSTSPCCMRSPPVSHLVPPSIVAVSLGWCSGHPYLRNEPKVQW